MKEIVRTKSNIDFVINPQIELLSVVQILADENQKEYKDWYADNKYYISEIRKWFGSYKNHPAILNYRKYYINNSQISKYSFSLKGNQNQVNLSNDEIEYFSLLDVFVKESSFIDFFAEMSNYFKMVLDYNVDKINDLNICHDLSDYYKQSIKIKVILKMTQGNWGEYISNDNNNFTVLCGINKNEDLPVFVDYKQLSSLCFHECTHPFVNKFITTDYDLLVKSENIFIVIDENSIARKNYFTYNDYLEDLIVRAITAYMHFKYGYTTSEEYKKELDYMYEIGFVYINDIASILEKNDFYSSVEMIKKYLCEKATLIKQK